MNLQNYKGNEKNWYLSYNSRNKSKRSALIVIKENNQGYNFDHAFSWIVSRKKKKKTEAELAVMFIMIFVCLDCSCYRINNDGIHIKFYVLTKFCN